MAIIKNIKMVVNAHMVTLQMFLTTRKVVADIRNVVVVSSKLTTTHPLVVRKITTYLVVITFNNRAYNDN
jgi:hypothetical protein